MRAANSAYEQPVFGRWSRSPLASLTRTRFDEAIGLSLRPKAVWSSAGGESGHRLHRGSVQALARSTNGSQRVGRHETGPAQHSQNRRELQAVAGQDAGKHADHHDDHGVGERGPVPGR